MNYFLLIIKIPTKDYIVNVCFLNSYNVCSHWKFTKFKKALAILLIATLSCVLWVISSQKVIRYTIGLFFLIHLFRFTEEMINIY